MFVDEIFCTGQLYEFTIFVVFPVVQIDKVGHQNGIVGNKFGGGSFQYVKLCFRP